MASLYKRGKTWSFSIDIGYDKDGNVKRKALVVFEQKKKLKVRSPSFRLIYLHVTKDMKKEVARKFDQLMDNL